MQDSSARYRMVGIDHSQTALQVDWADGHRSHFPSIWLLQACRCCRCGSSESAVRHIKLTDQPARPKILGAEATDGELVVDWGKNHRSRFDTQWLRAHCLSPAERSRRHPAPQPWGSELVEHLPYMTYDEVAGDPDRHLAFLENLRDLGFVILRHVPAARERTAEIAALVGTLRLTNYGIYELEAKPNPEIVGDMALAIEPHTDEPYRIDPPAITLFHVLKQSTSGGESILVDGFNLVSILQKRDPRAFEILSTTPARFHRVLREGRAFETQAPIISRDRQGAVIGVRLLDRGMAPVDVEPEQVEPFYDALRSFLQLVYGREGRITVKLEAREMLVFNNQRIMHGRTAFDPNGSQRHVRSCHVDLDEFYSRLRMAYRAQVREEAWMCLGPGARG